MEKSSFFNSVNGDRKYNAEDIAEYFRSFIGNGIFANPSTNLQVISNNNMTVILKAGKAWINGYFYYCTDDLIINIDNADGVLNRIDKIVIKMDKTARTISAEIKKGIFASNPVAPIITRNSDIYELGIADIYISKGTTSINQVNITDLRLNSNYCGIVHSTVVQADVTTILNQYTEKLNQKELDFEKNFIEWFNHIQTQLSGDVAGNLQLQIDTNKANINTLFFKTGDIQSHALFRENKDRFGIFTKISYKRKDGTVIATSLLSGGIAPKYTTRTVTYFDGTIETYSLSYDTDGVLKSEVPQ